MLTPYFFDFKMFFSVVYRSITGSDKIEAPLGFKRLLFLIAFVPFYLWIQVVNYIAFLIDEILFRGYRGISVKNALFIVGIPRSGTTFMHRLFSLDDQFTAVKTWEMIFAPAICQKYFWLFVGKLDAMIGSPFKKLILAFEKSVASEFNKIHKVGLFETEEDEVMFLTSFTSCYLYFFFPDRRMTDYVFFDEKLSFEQRKKIMDYRRALIKKHMFVFGEGKTYMTKNPADSGKIASIHEFFPDGKIVYLVRSPYQSVASVLNLFHNMYKVANTEMDKELLREMAEMSVSYWYEYAERALETVPEGQKVTVLYSDMVSDPITTAEKVYGDLGYTISEYFHEILVKETERAKQYTSKHNYDIETHGMTKEQITETYGHVFDRYGIPKQA